MSEKERIEQNWTYIEAWLNNNAKYFDSNDLAEGTSERELKLFQTEFKVELPLAFYHSYLTHNGFKEDIGLIHAGDLLSITDIKRYYYILTHQDCVMKWDTNTFPFVKFNESDFLCINFNNRQVYWVGIYEEEKQIISSKAYDSFSSFLSGLVNDLKEGNGCMGELLC